ncbi:hypothetical protein ILUMI_03382 [Ignelater luminosus]|uniref:Uncharacterized protein n=1 Tax=Ignelater luminosus TaxID=2038154 RepID=A0A8K0GJZ8_IGNLU|nr:hypothetical protein ILUMI_03382 [Ignelater luminosus]
MVCDVNSSLVLNQEIRTVSSNPRAASTNMLSAPLTLSLSEIPYDASPAGEWTDVAARLLRLSKLLLQMDMIDQQGASLKMYKTVSAEEFWTERALDNPCLGDYAKRYAAVTQLLVHKRRAKKFYTSLKESVDECQNRDGLVALAFDFVQNVHLPEIPDKNLAVRIRQSGRRNPNLSERTVTNKFGTSKATIHRVKLKAGLKTYKIQKVPDWDQEKKRRAKSRARKLYNDFFTKCDCCVMDDETYCVADISQIQGQEFYVASQRGKVAEQFKTRKASKYP